MTLRAGLSFIVSHLVFVTAMMAADFDGDGVPDQFKVTRDASTLAGAKDARTVDPWSGKSATKQPSKGMCIFVQLSREPQAYLIRSPFFASPMWNQEPRPLKVVGSKDRGYTTWKKQAPGIKGDGIELGTEAGIDILLYWDGKRWRVFEPAEDP